MLKVGAAKHAQKWIISSFEEKQALYWLARCKHTTTFFSSEFSVLFVLKAVSALGLQKSFSPTIC